MSSNAETAPPQGDPGPNDCARQLSEMFPALFGGRPIPLKLRIREDIEARAPGVFSKRALAAFFRRYTTSTAYLVALSRATQRFGLDGEPAGELSAEHRQAALQELARRRALREDRRALEQQQRRNRAALLRDYQSTTLTVANFCALKGIAVDELEGLLAIAQREAEEAARDQRPPAPPQRTARRR
jgi:hypothetical protein